MLLISFNLDFNTYRIRHMKSLSWGEFPTREEFDAAFEADETIKRMGGYQITHGSVTDDYDAAPALYEDSEELWVELQRLWKLWNAKHEDMSDDQERAAHWVSDILGTLGFEWI